MVRALERPAAAHAAALENLQREPVVLVGGALIDLQQPPPVGRHVGDRLPRETLEVLAHERDALGRTVGLLVVDRADPRVDLLEHVVPEAGRLDPRSAAEVGGGGRRNAVAGLPSEEGAITRVLLEEIAEKGRAGAEHPDHDERRVDRLVPYLGMLL